jgi:hypothetical protein
LFLDGGIDAHVNARGTNGTTLRITWIGCNRAQLTQLIKAEKMIAKFRAAGFTRLECDDGYDATAWTNL